MMSKDKALHELSKNSYVNMVLEETGYTDDSVNFKPAIKDAKKHIELYKLMDEYINLSIDHDKCESSSAKGLIHRRMSYLANRIAHDFWVFDTKKMMNPEYE